MTAAGLPPEGQTALRNVVERRLGDASLEDAANVLEKVVVMESALGKMVSKKNALHEQGVKLVKSKGDDDPLGGLRVLDVIGGFSHRQEELISLRRDLLKKAVVKEPENLELLSEFSVFLEEQGDLDMAEKLLAPRAGQLGSREGARVLGQI